MSIRFKRTLKPKVVLDLVPMIDIVFQLVIFFMVATTFKTTSGIELELPRAELLSEITTAPINITIVSKDNIKINDIKTDINGFKNIISIETSKAPLLNRTVVIYGDKNINYQLLIDIMDVLRLEGYESIDLAINKKR